jgi:hypothetical protein
MHPDLAQLDAPLIRNHRGLVVGETQVLLDTGELAGIAGRFAQVAG